MPTRPFLCVLLAWFATMGAPPAARAGEARKSDTTSFLEASRKIRSAAVEWEEVRRLTFADPAELADRPTPEGAWEIDDGKLWAAGGERNRAILLAPCAHDPVRIEFEATCYEADGRLGDITVLLNSVADKRFFGHGYALTTGSYWNNCTTFYKQGKAIARTEHSPVVSGRRNHVVLEFNRGHIRYWLNDRIILEAWDETPLAMDASLWIGVRTWATRMSVDNLVVSRAGGGRASHERR